MIKHSEEFRQEAVGIALTSGLPRERVASDLGIGKSQPWAVGRLAWRGYRALIAAPFEGWPGWMILRWIERVVIRVVV